VALHKPPLKIKELREVRDGLTKTEVQPILSKVICFVLLQVGSFGVVQCVGEISSVPLLFLRDLPHTYFVPALFSTKKQKTKETETSKGSTGLNTEEPKFINYYNCFILFYLFTQLFIIQHQ